jgi:hypothetical protein
MKPILPLIAILPLVAACGTPQEQCIARSTRDLRVVEQLIAESERNLARGYAVVETTEWRTDWEPCGPLLVDKNGKVLPRRMCLEDVPETVRRPKAIDLNAEAATLAQLKAKRLSLSRAAEPAIAACRRAYPE